MRKDKSYQRGNATYSEQYSKLLSEAKASEGSLLSFRMELIRVCDILLTEYYDNANSEACFCSQSESNEPCPRCGGAGGYTDDDGEWVECDYCGGNGFMERDEMTLKYSVDKRYVKYLELIRHRFVRKPQEKAVNGLLEAVADIITESVRIVANSGIERLYAKYRQDSYNHLVDYVVADLLENPEDCEVPRWYREL